MKNLLPSLILCVLLALCAPFATPQQSQNDGTAPVQREPPLRQRLALTHDQYAQMRAINNDRKSQVDAVKADASLSPSQRKQKIREIRADAETKFRAILNEEQLNEYDQMKSERQDRAARKRQTDLPPQ